MPREIFELLTPRLLNVPRALACRYARPGTYYYGELVSDGYVGLLEAALKFDPARGVSFFTFAYALARWKMLQRVNPRKGSPEAVWGAYRSLDEASPQGGTLGDALEAPARRGPAEAAEDAEFCDAALAGVPHAGDFREYHGGGGTLRQLAARRGVHYKTMAARLRRAGAAAAAAARAML